MRSELRLNSPDIDIATGEARISLSSEKLDTLTRHGVGLEIVYCTSMP